MKLIVILRNNSTIKFKGVSKPYIRNGILTIKDDKSEATDAEFLETQIIGWYKCS